MKRSYLIAAGIAFAAAGWILSGQVDGNIETDRAEPASAPAAAEVAVALPQVRVRSSTARERVSELVLFGRSEAERMVELRAETAARVVAIKVVKGQRVAKGDAIAQLAMDDRQARLSEAEAVVEQYRIAYEAAQKLSQKQYRSKVKLAETRAQLETAKAALAAIRLDIARTVIRAPFAGVVEALPAEVGDYLAVGAVVAHIVDLDPILIVGEVAERDIAKVTTGSLARVRLTTGEVVEGTVRYVSRVGTKSTRTFRIEVALANPGGAIAEGLTAELWLPVGLELAHLVSPAVLTLSDDGVVGVKVVDDKDVVDFFPVRMVADTPDGVWLGGLPETITLITVGQEFVLPGQRVIPVPEDGNGGS